MSNTKNADEEGTNRHDTDRQDLFTTVVYTRTGQTLAAFIEDNLTHGFGFDEQSPTRQYMLERIDEGFCFDSSTQQWDDYVSLRTKLAVMEEESRRNMPVEIQCFRREPTLAEFIEDSLTHGFGFDAESPVHKYVEESVDEGYPNSLTLQWEDYVLLKDRLAAMEQRGFIKNLFDYRVTGIGNYGIPKELRKAA